MRSRPRRVLTGIAIAAAAGLTLASCAGGGGSASGDLTATGPITIWYSNNTQEVAWGKAMVDAWN